MLRVPTHTSANAERGTAIIAARAVRQLSPLDEPDVLCLDSILADANIDSVAAMLALSSAKRADLARRAIVSNRKSPATATQPTY